MADVDNGVAVVAAPSDMRCADVSLAGAMQETEERVVLESKGKACT